MLLRVVDIRIEDAEHDSDVEIQLYKSDFIDCAPLVSFTCSYYPSPLSSSFRETIAWYYSGYLQEVQASISDKELLPKMIRLGQNMGDNLLGEDHELGRVTEIIENEGIGNLSVLIESSRADFFDERWELLILPESKYILSTATKSFLRQFPDNMLSITDAEINYELSSKLPLKVLHVISRPKNSQGLKQSSDAFGAYVDTFCLDGAISYEIFPVQCRGELDERLLLEDIHILHYDGPILLEDEVPYLLLDDSASPSKSSERIPLKLVSQRLARKGKGLLVLAVTDYLDGSLSMDSSLGLTLCAREAGRYGVGNVLGMTNIADPWTNSLSYEFFYKNITRGFTVSRAVIETRKFLQTQTSNSVFVGQQVPFHTWPLLAQFGGQKVTYFNAPQTISDDIVESAPYLRHRQNLHGFLDEFLPPFLSHSGERNLLSALMRTRKSNSIYISGGAGSGKTRLCHQLALLVRGEVYEHGFYFDFMEHEYSQQDVLEMISPVLLKHDSHLMIDESFTITRNIFIFDNLGKLQNQPSEEWGEFLNNLVNESNLVIISGEMSKYSVFKKHVRSLEEVCLSPLTLIECRVIAAPILREYSVQNKSGDIDYICMLEAFRGNPFLLKKTIPLIAAHSCRTIQNKTKELLSKDIEKTEVERFYDWQWREMDLLWQRWLLQLIEYPYVLLEMISIACDQKNGFPPAEELVHMFGVQAKEKFGEGIKLMYQAGFLLRHPHGKVIDPRAIPFLKEQREKTGRPNAENIDIEIKVSQVVCEGVRMLITHHQLEPNPTIIHHIMMNRGEWVKHSERIWFAGDYRGFLALNNRLSQIMVQHNLMDEMARWSMDLLSRTTDFHNVDMTNMEKMSAYVNVGVIAMYQPEPILPGFIKQAAQSWQDWMENLNSDEVKQQSALFYHCIRFLESVYRHGSEVDNLRDLSLVAYNGYKAHEVWLRALPHLIMLTECSFILEDKTMGEKYENELLNSIPYEQLPSENKSEIFAKVCASRITRRETVGAQYVLDKIRVMKGSSNSETLIDALQADIFFQQDSFKCSAELYCHLWKVAINGNSNLNAMHICKQLIDLKKKMGDAELTEIFYRIAGSEIITPEKYRVENN